MKRGRYLRIPEIHLVLLQHLPADHASMVDDDVEVGPGSELALPVGDGGERGDDEERPFNAHAVDLLQEGDGLDGLSQAHLVCQDAVSSDERRQKRPQRRNFKVGQRCQIKEVREETPCLTPSVPEKKQRKVRLSLLRSTLHVSDSLVRR